MADLAPALQQTLRFEGGYSNEPADTGGETYRGVSRNNFPDNSIWAIIDRINNPKGTIRRGQIIGPPDGDILDGIISKFYRIQFWDGIRGDDIASQSVAGYLFDWSVTSGNIPIRQVQEILGVNVDGHVGVQTLAAINGADAHTLFNQMVAIRVQRVKDRVAHDASQKVFLKGLLKRFQGFQFEG